MTDQAIATTDTDLVRTLELGLEVGSLKGLVQETAERVMLLLDTSGSMWEGIEDLRVVVRNINPRGNGFPMIAFGGPYDAEVRFVDVVPDPAGGTPLHVAIPYAKEYGATRLVVISDGYPDLKDQALIEAKKFGGRIDVCYIGCSGDSGSIFLDELARVTGGKRTEGDVSDTKQLENTVIGYLEGEVEPAKAPIQGEGFTTVEPPVDEEEEDEQQEEDEDDEE